MYKSILVPLDGSKRAERILSHVEELAHCFEAKVVLLRVVEPSFDATSPHNTNAKLRADVVGQSVDKAKSYLAALQGGFREKGIQVKTIIEKGAVVMWICNVAEREDVDPIAMASHGRTGLERVFYGSVAAGVLHRVDRPLLLIRAGETK